MGPGFTYRNEPDKTKHSFEGTSPAFDFAGTEIQGWRLSMEDAHLAVTNYGGDPSAALFGVFDGHGGIFDWDCCVGPAVSEFTKRRLPDVLLKNSNYISGNYEIALKEAFLRIDEILSTEDGREEIKAIHAELNKKAQANPGPKNPMEFMLGEESPEGEGCTANVILFKKGFIYVANAGDSRSVLAQKGVAKDLSVDHKPEDEVEHSRITKAGGSIQNGRVDGNLNLSRSLGDLQYKKNPALKPEEQKISAMPDVVKVEVKDFDFIVMGCDGIYDSQTSQQIVSSFYSEFEKSPKKKLVNVIEDFVDSLVSTDFMTTEGKGCDNMTCIVIKFK